MADKQVDVFFYGLFMDNDILRGQQVLPANPRRGYVDGLALRIAHRALLIARPGARAYGVVFGLTHAEIDRLYSVPSLEQYRPDPVLVRTLEGTEVPALCYNLPQEPAPEEHNPEYAARLRAVVTKLGFSKEYADLI